jgi:hypothetical protein
MPQKLNRRDFVMASNNGNRSKDTKTGLTCVATAFKMTTEGKDVLDAVIAIL